MIYVFQDGYLPVIGAAYSGAAVVLVGVELLWD